MRRSAFLTSLKRRGALTGALCLCLFQSIACSGGTESAAGAQGYVFDLPAGFPAPQVPADNPMNADKVELGRRLFYEQGLSTGGNISCASCHQQRMAFSDGLPGGVGSTGEVNRRNSMSLTNTAYQATLTWANHHLRTFEEQATIPLFGEFPIELGLDDVSFPNALAGLDADESYAALFRDAFPESEDPVTKENLLKAIGAFQRTLISGNSAFDRGELSASALRGSQLFFSERLECFHCHGGFNFSSSLDHEGNLLDEISFHNNGLYNVGGTGDYPASDQGLIEVSGSDADMGKFKAPTLRNIELTAPYMHDGSIATLEEVVDHYAAGGRTIDPPDPNAGDGSANPHKDVLISGFIISAQEKQDLINFLKSLTDWEFVCNPALSDPFGNIPPHASCTP